MFYLRWVFKNLWQSAAWNLIRNIVGDVVERSDVLYFTKIEVAQKFAFTSIENTLKNNRIRFLLKNKKTFFLFKNALEVLKRSFFRMKKQGDAIASDLGEVEFVYGSLRIMIDFGFGLLRVRVVSGSNYLVSDFFRLQLAFESGLFQIWAIANEGLY